jgi:hypothetical protein
MKAWRPWSIYLWGFVVGLGCHVARELGGHLSVIVWLSVGALVFALLKGRPA